MIRYKLKKSKIKLYVWLIFIFILFIMSLWLPYVSSYKYSDQNLDLIDVPPVLKLRVINESEGIYISKDLYPVIFSLQGRVKFVPKLLKSDLNLCRRVYYMDDNKFLILDYKSIKDFKDIDYNKIKIIWNNKILNNRYKITVWNKSNILGTDHLGRDIFTRLFEGIKVSLIIGFVASVVNMVIGVIYGGISGYVGGKLDIIMLSFLNLIYSVPSILLIILLSMFIPPSIWTIIIVIGCVYWINMARQVRAGVIALKEQDFILAEKILGLSDYKIIFYHIIPNMKEIILTTLIVNIQNSIFAETYLSFLGIGLPAPIASLGTLINDAIANFRSSPYQLIIPSVAIVIIFICLNTTIGYSSYINNKNY